MASKFFNAAGASWQKWEVPKGVTLVEVVVQGAGSDGVEGGRTTGFINVKNVKSLWVQVGVQGKANSGNNGGNKAAGGGGPGGDGVNRAGGYGGGGSSTVRIDSAEGALAAIAGGAGGSGGDGAAGGQGGGLIGEAGFVTTGGQPGVSTATGGTQGQRGQGGNSNAGNSYGGDNGDGGDRPRSGGRGGQVNNGPSHGGGGGGGGYNGGGGGAASDPQDGFTGGGGAGGSSYIGGLRNGAQAQRGGGQTGDGQVRFIWSTADLNDNNPNPPSDIKIDGKDEGGSNSDPLKTGYCGGKFDISAVPTSPKSNLKVRIGVIYATSANFQQGKVGPLYCEDDHAKYGAQNERHRVFLSGIKKDTQYYYRVFTEDEKGRRSENNTGSFVTNQRPRSPNNLTPSDRTLFNPGQPVPLTWNHRDPNNDAQDAFDVQYRIFGTSTWTTIERRGSNGNPSNYVIPANRLEEDTRYEWRVRTYDGCNKAGDWSNSNDFFVGGSTVRPKIIEPEKCEARDVHDEITFRWRFIDAEGDDQIQADIRFSTGEGPDGEILWREVPGTGAIPGSDNFWTFPAEEFQEGVTYQWQVRTYDSSGASVSGWSRSGCFTGSATPGGLIAESPVFGKTQEALGCGTYRVFVYERGGQVMKGEITPLSLVRWGRVRDDISGADIWTNGFSQDCCNLLAGLRSWMHEIVIFRDGVRVWEGPITRLTYKVDRVEIEAKDVMAYVYRRIMRQGYNDISKDVNNTELGLTPVTRRARQIIMNALVYDDPNVIGYLYAFIDEANDARNSRARLDYSRTAWEEVDDLAATGGLDYTTVGRRIMLWDTHVPIGKLAEMRDGDFSDDPIVTEYGMQLANYFVTTNNAGVWGDAVPNEYRNGNPNRRGLRSEANEFYGWIEQLASAYGEVDGAPTEALTKKARNALEKTLDEQSERNIANRWTTPLVVRVPDNTTLNPNVNLSINQLIPGVWIPLRSVGTCRPVSQWQKLDVVSVEETPETGERIAVTMGPAPNGGQDDPDLVVSDAG